MSRPTIFRRIALICTLLGLSACGSKGGFDLNNSIFKNSGNDSSSLGNSDGGADAGVNPQDPDAYQKLQYKGYVSGGNDDGALVVDIDKVNNALLVILPLQINQFIESAEGTIPDLPGVKFTTFKDDKGESFFAISVPLRFVRKGASFLNPARLPNGDPLPQIASGELPSVAMAIPGKNNVKFNFYIGVNVVGIFVSSPYDPTFALHFPIRRGVDTIGYFHTVPAKDAYNGGFFINTQMPDSIAAVIDDHFRF